MKKLRLGTRGSPLALIQAKMVKSRIESLHTNIKVEIIVIKTTGDWVPAQGNTRLYEIQPTGQWAGKGLFAKEIEEGMMNKTIDIAVHSMKDMEIHLPQNLMIEHMLPRDDPRDAMILGEKAKNATHIENLPQDCIIGTSSPRRAAFLLHKRKDIKIVPLRGNVQTRIEKLKHGMVDAIFLACAGLDRLKLANEIGFRIAPEDILPAAGQGVIGIETTEQDKDIIECLTPISCPKTVLCITAERAALRELDGSCNTPIGAYATLNSKNIIHLRVAVGEKDGSNYWFEEHHATVKTKAEAQDYGAKIGKILKRRIPKHIL